MRRLLVTGVALVTLLLAGCGIPDESDVKDVGAAPSAGPSYGDDGTPPVQFTRAEATDPTQLVDYYLQAAAGDSDGALDRVKEFMAPETKAAFKPSTTTGVEVVRTVDKVYTPGNAAVTLRVQHLGQLQSDGLLDPSSDPTPISLTIDVGTLPNRSGYYITKAPAKLLLSDTALSTFYQRRTIYFWNNAYTGLVPDVRYMPLSVPTVQQPTMILNWLAGSPAGWLQKSVQTLPENTIAPDNVPAVADGRLQINLNPEAAQPGDQRQTDRLRDQLQWSLGNLAPPTLELRIGHQNPVTYTDNGYLASNPGYRLADTPEQFVIYNGVIRRLSDSPQSVSPVPLLKPEANKGIQTAALSTSSTHTFAAVVTGSKTAGVLRVAAAPHGSQAELRVVKGLSGTLGHPDWAVTAPGGADGATGLITADGKLYSFSADGSARPVEWQGGVPGPVSAVSVAPDGVRVALVAGGQLYRAVLTTSGDGVALAGAERLVPPGVRSGSVTAVAWSSEGWLAVAGALTLNGRFTVMDVTVDGVLSFTRLPDIGTDKVKYLTAYPANPRSGEEYSDTESYVAGSKDEAWNIVGDPVKITVAGLAAGQGGTAAPGVTPTAPFFLD
jgi:hypothetical protein